MATSGSYVITENGKFEMVIGNNVRSFTITKLDNTNNDNTGYLGLIFTGKAVEGNQDIVLMVWN